jgi:hypothetical protein
MPFSQSLIAQKSSIETPDIRIDPNWFKVFKAGSFIPSDIEVDEKGNIYATGTFNSTIEFENGQVLTNKNERFNGIANTFFLIKLNPKGEFIWASHGIGKSRTCGVEIDKKGHIYIAGEVFSPQLEIKTKSATSHLLDKPTAVTSRGLFICKYDSNGQLNTSRFYSDGYREVALDLKIDKNSNLLIAGNGFYTKNSESKRKYMLAVFDSSLTKKWVAFGTDKGRSQLNAISYDKKGNIYTSGSYTNYLKIEDLELDNENNSQIAFIAKFSKEGDLQWTQNHLNPNTELETNGTGIVLATNRAGTSFLGGNSSGTPFLVRLNKNGKPKWYIRNSGRFSSAYSKIILSPKNSIYLCGQGMASTFSSISGNEMSFSSNGATDFFWVNYTQYGTLISLNSGGGKVTDYADGMAIYKDKIIMLGHLLGGKTTFLKKGFDFRNNIMWIGQFDNKNHKKGRAKHSLYF